MNPIDYDELLQFVLTTYEHIAKRPAMFAGRVEAIESFVFALEFVLDHFGGTNREHSYSAFKSSDQFGNEPLVRCFERINEYRLGFIVNGETPSLLPPDVFQKAFKDHWSRFLDSIRRNN